MIHFFIGTKAQFIKMAPLMLELQSRAIEYRYVDSGQHAGLTAKLRKCFGIAEPDVHLNKGKDITTIFSAIKWTLQLLSLAIFNKKKLKEIFPGGGICLIHGDTLSTILGLLLAKAAGLKVAHIEAGLRSFCIFHPFPEELIRIYCMKKCDLLFAPSEESFNNLKKMKLKGAIYFTDGNTVADSIRIAEKLTPSIEMPAKPFALATCHRLETIASRKRLCRVVELINKVSEKTDVVFVIHSPTRKYLEKFGLFDRIRKGIEIKEMLDYIDFTSLIKASRFVLADGGSIQEECFYLNKPCLILRNKTERPDGLGENAMLWNFDDSVAEKFLAMAENYADTAKKTWPNPSSKIADKLVKFG